MAMQDAGDHRVSLDQAIRTMYQTGLVCSLDIRKLRQAGWRSM